ncbi:MAG: deoxynucleoside kinase, partial [Oscillospiraceae bacterium]|nr:deoxynucleoside kinase [Oscillospiraceae bacterium]
MPRGKLIVIEGLDGSGKATQSQLLASRLHPALRISFPDYSDESSALVKMYLSGGMGPAGEVNAYAASSFYASDRYISYHSSWKKNHITGETVIADRYTTSNAVHQMPKLPRSEWDSYLEWLYDYEFVRMKLPVPDIVIYLDMPPESAQKLMLERYGGNETLRDAHERDLAYQLS